jgi:hypothetical protein
MRPPTLVFVVGKQLSDAKVRTDGTTLATNVNAIGQCQRQQVAR